MLRVAVLDDFQHIAASMADWSVLDGRARVTFFHDHVEDETALANRLADYECIVAMRERTPLQAGLLGRLPQLRVIVTSGWANAVIDVAAANERGVLVCGTQSWFGVTSTIEHVWGLIFALARRIPQEHDAIRSNGWMTGLPTMLSGRTLGIVGLGNLGSLVPPVAKALGMRVVGWSRNLDPAKAAELGVEALGHDEFFAQSDVVTVHVKMSERSRHYIGAAELALMRPSAFLVNTSRGPIVDQGALLEALRNGRLAGAALDVFDPEPLPIDHPLRTQPNVVLSPHNGYANDVSYRDYFTQVVEDLDAYLRGEPVRVIGQ